MKISEILILLKEDGWYLAATKGSNRQFKHPHKPGRVTVPGKLSDDFAMVIRSQVRHVAGENGWICPEICSPEEFLGNEL